MGTYCERIAPPPTLCADFDEGDPSAVLVDGKLEAFAGAAMGTGTRALGMTTSKSAPASLRVDIPATGGTQGRQILSRTLSASMTHVKIAFDLHVEAVAPALLQVITLGGLEMGGAEPYKLNLALEATDAGALPLYVTEVFHADGGSYTFNQFLTSASVPLKTWTRLTLDVTFQASGGGTMVVGIGEPPTVVLSRPTRPDLLGPPTLTLDLFTTSPGITVHYDDYVVVAQP